MFSNSTVTANPTLSKDIKKLSNQLENQEKAKSHPTVVRQNAHKQNFQLNAQFKPKTSSYLSSFNGQNQISQIPKKNNLGSTIVKPSALGSFNTQVAQNSNKPLTAAPKSISVSNSLKPIVSQKRSRDEIAKSVEKENISPLAASQVKKAKPSQGIQIKANLHLMKEANKTQEQTTTPISKGTNVPSLSMNSESSSKASSNCEICKKALKFPQVRTLKCSHKFHIVRHLFSLDLMFSRTATRNLIKRRNLDVQLVKRI